MLKHLPTFVDTTARTIARQASILPVAWQSGDFTTVALLSLTLVFLIASVVGSFLILALTILPPLTMAWKWTQGITRRVVPVAGATAVFAGSIGFLWYPDATRIYQRLSAPAPSRIALELFEQAAVATAKVSSIRADVEGAIGPELYNGSITLKRPNLAHITISGEGGLGTFQVISDGNKLHTFFPADNSFVASGPGKHGEYVNAYVADQIAFFFQPDSIKAAMKKGKAAHAGTLPLDGETYDLVDQSLDDGRNTTLRYFIAQSDHMIHGVSTSRAGETLKWSRLKRVKRDAALDSATFAWTPPQDASTAGLPSGLNLPIGPMK
jgi:outer membrane lipoprotein-sorting protein